MDTCFPLLQPKHHCVKVTGERDREKPTNHKSESKNGSRAGQEASKRRKECEAGGGEMALLLTREDIAKEKSCRCRRSAEREARPSTGQGGWKVQRILEGGGRGVTVSSCPLCAPEPFADLQGGMVGNLAPKAEKDGEEVSHKNVLQADSTGLLL